jgi:hypothetical protein
MSAPVARTASGQRLDAWFRQQLDAMDRATEECSTEARQYIRGQMKVLERARDHVMREVAYCEVEAVSMVTAGSTLADADRWLDDATGGETPDKAA